MHNNSDTVSHRAVRGVLAWAAVFVISGGTGQQVAAPSKPDVRSWRLPEGAALRFDSLPGVRSKEGETSLTTFSLDDATTMVLWPPSEHWYLKGLRIAPTCRGSVLIDVIDGRHDGKQLGWISAQLGDAPADFVVAFKFLQNPARRARVGELRFYGLTEGTLTLLRRFDLDYRGAPQEPSRLIDGWLSRPTSMPDLPRTLGFEVSTWSWNGPHTDEVAHAVGPVFRTGLVEPEVAAIYAKWSKIAIRDWPEAVWFLRAAYSADGKEVRSGT